VVQTFAGYNQARALNRAQSTPRTINMSEFLSLNFARILRERYAMDQVSDNDVYDLLEKVTLIQDGYYDHLKKANDFIKHAEKIAKIKETIFPKSNEHTDDQISLASNSAILKNHLEKAEDILRAHHRKGTRQQLDIIAVCEACSEFWLNKLDRTVQRSESNIAECDNERFIWDILKESSDMHIPNNRKYNKDLFDGFNNALRNAQQKFKKH
jgi:hypothetical protein